MRRKKKRPIKGILACLALIATITSLLFYKELSSGDLANEGRQLWSLVFAEKTRGGKEASSLPDIDSKNGILINLDTDVVVGSKKPDKKIYPASMTKIMSAYVVIQHLTDLDQRVPISGEIVDQAVSEGASMAGFIRDEEVPVLELLYGTLLSSGAEATEALAIEVAGSEKNFVKLMNQEAKKIGMTQTNFKNATGLHQRNHYSTVEDMALLLKTALKNETFSAIFNSKEHIYKGDNHPEGLYLASTLFSHLPINQQLAGELNGGKTGYTEEAGQCLASLATINGQRYILVTAGASGTPMTKARHIEDAFTVYRSL